MKKEGLTLSGLRSSSIMMTRFPGARSQVVSFGDGCDELSGLEILGCWVFSRG
jgi:hypothetical protein